MGKQPAILPKPHDNQRASIRHPGGYKLAGLSRRCTSRARAAARTARARINQRSIAPPPLPPPEEDGGGGAGVEETTRVALLLVTVPAGLVTTTV